MASPRRHGIETLIHQTKPIGWKSSCSSCVTRLAPSHAFLISLPEEGWFRLGQRFSTTTIGVFWFRPTCNLQCNRPGRRERLRRSMRSGKVRALRCVLAARTTPSLCAALIPASATSASLVKSEDLDAAKFSACHHVGHPNHTLVEDSDRYVLNWPERKPTKMSIERQSRW